MVVKIISMVVAEFSYTTVFLFISLMGNTEFSAQECVSHMR